MKRLNRLLPRLNGCLLALALLAAAGSAGAQTVTITDATPERTVDNHPGDDHDDRINYADCIADDTFTFTVTLTNVGDAMFQVWAGGADDCTVDESRTGSNNTCWRVYAETLYNGSHDIPIRARAIVARQLDTELATAEEVGTMEEACGDGISQNLPTDVALYFMLADANTATAVASAPVNLVFDLAGPEAPTEVEAGVGEQRLSVSWKPPEANDVEGYRIYCAVAERASQPAASESLATGGTGLATAAPASGTAGASGRGGGGGSMGGITGGAGGVTSVAAGGTTSPLAGAGGRGGAGGTTDIAGEEAAVGTGGATSSSSCGSSVLVEGQRPPATLEPCGEVAGKPMTTAYAEGLENWKEYAVAVAAVDQSDNVGPLSAVRCAEPQEVNDFFELYRNSGGKGGGGCSLARRSVPGVAALLVGGLGCWIARRRRRRSGPAGASGRQPR